AHAGFGVGGLKGRIPDLAPAPLLEEQALEDVGPVVVSDPVRQRNDDAHLPKVVLPAFPPRAGRFAQLDPGLAARRPGADPGCGKGEVDGHDSLLPRQKTMRRGAPERSMAGKGLNPPHGALSWGAC